MRSSRRNVRVGPRLQFTLRSLFVITMVVAAYFAGYVSHRRRAGQLELDLETAKRDAKLTELRNSLKVSCGALYCDRGTVKRINELRKESFVNSGITVQFPDDRMGRIDKQGNPVGVPTEVWDRSMGYEKFMRERAINSCKSLTRALRERTGLGEHFSDNPDIFRQEVRPLLLRLLGGSLDGYFQSQLNLAACGTLLASGDRSEKTMDLLEQVLQTPKIKMYDYSTKTHAYRHRLEKRVAIRLNQQYQLGFPVNEDNEPEASTEPVEE